MGHTLTELIDFLRGKNVYIQTHNFPDADAIASAFGMQKILEHYGIRSTLCYHGVIDRINMKKMVSLLGIEIVAKDSLEGMMKEEDPIVCVDSQKHGGNILDLVGDEVAAIDHHPTVKEIEYFYKDVRIVGACATIITGYFRELNIPMDRTTATALLYGLKMDTSGFSRGVKEEDIEAFSFLNELADQDILRSLETNQLEMKDIRAYGAAVNNMIVEGRYGFTEIPFACPDALIAITCDFLLSIEEVDVAIVYARRTDGFKFSVRAEEGAEEKVDCGELISKALEGLGSGGGHAFMAGGFLPAANLDRLCSFGEDVGAAIRSRFLKQLS